MVHESMHTHFGNQSTRYLEIVHKIYISTVRIKRNIRRMPQHTYAFFRHLKIVNTFCTLNSTSIKYWSNNKLAIPLDQVSNPEFLIPNILLEHLRTLKQQDQSEESCRDQISVTRPPAYSDEAVRAVKRTEPHKSKFIGR